MCKKWTSRALELLYNLESIYYKSKIILNTFGFPNLLLIVMRIDYVYSVVKSTMVYHSIILFLPANSLPVLVTQGQLSYMWDSHPDCSYLVAPPFQHNTCMDTERDWRVFKRLFIFVSWKLTASHILFAWIVSWL